MSYVFKARYSAGPVAPGTRTVGVPGSIAPGSGWVAVKVLRPGLARGPEAREYFMNEARHQERLDHAHILKVIEISDGEPLFYVMPLGKAGAWRMR